MYVRHGCKGDPIIRESAELQIPEVLNPLDALGKAYQGQIDFVAETPHLSHLDAVEQGGRFDADLLGREAYLGRLVPIGDDAYLRVAQIQTWNGAQLGAGDERHDVPENTPAQKDQALQVGPADVHINRTPRSRHLGEKACLGYNWDHSRDFSKHLLQKGYQLPGPKRIGCSRPHKDSLAKGDVKEIGQGRSVEGVAGFGLPVFAYLLFHKSADIFQLFEAVAGRGDHDAQNEVPIPFRKVLRFGRQKPGHGQGKNGEQEHDGNPAEHPFGEPIDKG